MLLSTYGYAGLILRVPFLDEIKNTLFPEDWVYTNPEDEMNAPSTQDFGVHLIHHVTLKYGFIPGLAQTYDLASIIQDNMDSIDALNNGFAVTALTIFETPDESPYNPLVLELAENEPLAKLHGELSKLPHVDTFYPYKPHITIGYFKKEFAEDAKARVERALFTREQGVRVLYDLGSEITVLNSEFSGLDDTSEVRAIFETVL